MNLLENDYSKLCEFYRSERSFYQNHNNMAKIYFSHTTKLEVTKKGIIPACTIALMKRGNKFIYGVAICSKFDNFSKKYGREVAQGRLDQEFGTLDVPKVLEDLDDKKACLEQLYNLVASVVTKNKKWKKRITKFNLQNKSIGKVVSMDTLKPVA